MAGQVRTDGGDKQAAEFAAPTRCYNGLMRSPTRSARIHLAAMAALAFAACDEASHITGQTMHVNGGQVLG